MNLKKLIEEVLGDLANNKPLASVTTKVQIISRFLKNEAFIKWVNRELIEGYSTDAEVPPIRKLQIAEVRVSYIQHCFGGIAQYKNQTMPIMNLGVEKYKEIVNITERQPISILQGCIKEDENINLSLSSLDTMYIQELLKDCQIQSGYKVTSFTSYHAIINDAKSKLIDLFIDFNETIFNNEIDFNTMNKKEEIQKIVTKNIYTGIYVDGTSNISGGNIVGGQGNNVTISTETKNEIIDILKKIEDLATEENEDRTDIADAIITIREELDNKMCRPKFLKAAFNGLKGLGIGVVKDQISGYVSKALESIVKL